MTRRTSEQPVPNPRDDLQRPELLELLRMPPERLVQEIVELRRNCRQATEAAEGLNGLLQDLVNQNANMHHLEAIRETPDGQMRAVCRAGSHLQELGVHPSVPIDSLRNLQPWDYVCVHDGVVIGTWADDPSQFAHQHGDLVTFEGYYDKEQFQVRTSQPGREPAIVTLAPSLRSSDLRSGTRLVLLRDDPRWAIAAMPAENADSKFEVPLDRVTKRLEDLAGLDDVSSRFIVDILLRVVFTDIREQFDLTPLRGALLISRQPGMGKSALCEALAVWLRDYGDQYGFDVVLYYVKPNQLKSMWWGEDARIVREELFGSIRARQAVPRRRALVQLLIMDEIDSLQKRGGGSERTVSSSSHSDALEALLVELQGLGAGALSGDPPAHLLCIGLTNRPARIDDALKRPGRLGDLVCEMPAITPESAADIMAIYARKDTLPWSQDGLTATTLPLSEIRRQFLCPAVARVFPLVVARYATDTQRTVNVTAGEILASVHYQEAVNRAKRCAGLRSLHQHGIPAILADDVIDALLDVAVDTARQMEADPGMLIHQLQVTTAVTRVTAVAKSELEQHRYIRLHSA